MIATTDKGLVALARKSLFIKWNLQTKSSLVFTAPYTTAPFVTIESSPIFANGIVYFRASDGYFYCVESASGIVTDKINLGAPIFSSPALTGNVLVISDFAGNIYAFATKNSN